MIYDKYFLSIPWDLYISENGIPQNCNDKPFPKNEYCLKNGISHTERIGGLSYSMYFISEEAMLKYQLTYL